MKIVISPDSFKGSLSAIEAAIAIEKGIKAYNTRIETILLPVADGGEGTMSSLMKATDGEIVQTTVEDPLGRKTLASYGILGDNKTCIIEMAEASGLMLLHEDERNPAITSSYGTGELILHALNKGIHNFIIGLGGSATNDGGSGMLEALGAKFLDETGQVLRRGGIALRHLHAIDITAIDKRIKDCHFLIASDVTNPLVGSDGASFIFGPQKGASQQLVKQLDQSLTRLADVIQETTGIHMHHEKGAGAAGGVGGMLQAFFPCEMKSGIDVLLDAVAFSEKIEDADLIITGEGKTDAQTLYGKAPFGVALAAKKKGVPVILLSGIVDEAAHTLLKPFFIEVHAVVGETVTKEQSIENAALCLQSKAARIIQTYSASFNLL